MDDKKAKSSIKNTIMALIILFLIPLSVNLILENVGGSLSACWKGGRLIYGGSGYQKTEQDKNSDKQTPVNDADKYEEGEEPGGDRSVLSKEGISSIKAKSVGNDHMQFIVGDIKYEVYGQNESGFSQTLLRDGRTFSTGGCGPTALATALSSFGYEGNPVEVNKAGSDVTPESHEKAIKNLQKQGKLSKTVKVDTYPKSSLPKSSTAFYNQIKDALMENHAIVMDIREGSKQGQNYCNIYGTGDYFDNEGAIHAHWTAIVAYDPSNDQAFFANSCGSRQWAPLKKIMDLTYEAVSGKVFNDEGGWVGSYVEIYE